MKTQVEAPEGQADLWIRREFDLPVNLLFQAYTDADIVAQWMGTQVLKLDCQNHGSFQFLTVDPKGEKHGFNGVIHAVTEGRKIVRTFEMEQSPFGVQLEILEFIHLSDQRSQLQKHVIYESVSQRDANLRLPFKQGINWAHNRLEEIVQQLKNKV